MNLRPTLPAPPTVVSPLGAAWLFDALPAVVTQVTVPRMDRQVAEFLAWQVHREVEARYFAGPKKILYVHDWRAVQGYAIDARERLLEWGRVGGHKTLETVVLMSPEASPFVRIALHTGAAVMRGLGMRFSVQEQVGDALVRFADLVPVPPRG